MKTFSRSLLTLAAMTFFCLTASASYADKPACGAKETWAQFKQRVETAFPKVQAQEISGSAKETLVAQYNATPPTLPVAPDKVRFLTRPDTPTALVVYSKDSCVLAAAYIPVNQLVRLLAMGPKGIEV